MGSMRHSLILALIFQTVSLIAQTDRSGPSVGDTVLLKARHRSTGVVLVFVGRGLCPPCISALAEVDRHLYGTRLPIEVYVGDALESSASTTLKQNLSHAKLYDDETFAVAHQYRIDTWPTFMFISPSGVIRGLTFPGVKGTTNDDMTAVIDGILGESSSFVFRGPSHQRARLSRAVTIPSEVLPLGGENLQMLFDPLQQQFFCWSARSSTIAYVLDTNGRIVTSYDMTAAAAMQAPARLDIKAWDNQNERVLLSDNSGSKGSALYWYGLRSLSVDTMEYDLDPLLRGSMLVYNPSLKACAQTLHLPYVLGGRSNDDLTVYIKTPTASSRAVPKSSLYARDSIVHKVLYSTLASCPGGFVTSQVLTDTVHFISGADLSVSSFHVPLPTEYHTPYHIGMEQYRTVPGSYRNGVAYYSELIRLMGDDTRPEHIMCSYVVPSKVLDNVERPAFFDWAFVVLDYNMSTKTVESAFELPQGVEEIATCNGAMICKDAKSVPPRIAWFVSPSPGARNK